MCACVCCPRSCCCCNNGSADVVKPTASNEGGDLHVFSDVVIKRKKAKKWELILKGADTSTIKIVFILQCVGHMDFFSLNCFARVLIMIGYSLWGPAVPLSEFIKIYKRHLTTDRWQPLWTMCSIKQTLLAYMQKRRTGATNDVEFSWNWWCTRVRSIMDG